MFRRLISNAAVSGFVLFVMTGVVAPPTRGDEAKPETVRVWDGPPLVDGIPADSFLYQDDILMRHDQVDERGAGIWSPTLWPDGVVPYQFDPNVSSLNQTRARTAMNAWENSVARVRFVPRTNEADYLHIRANLGNSSYVGRSGGAQMLNIFSWADQITIAHELCHALGFWHEQSRPDRDSYISVQWQNIQAGYEHNFQTTDSWPTPYFTAYDLNSIMHYDRCAFSTCCPAGATCGCSAGCRTINVLPPNQNVNIGQPDGLSALDILDMALVYGCDAWVGSVTGIAASDGQFCDRTRITWSPFAGAVVYEVWRSTTSSFDAAERVGTSAGTSFDDSTTAPSTTYSYWVRAITSSCAGQFSGRNTGYSGAPPEATGFGASDGATCGAIRVSWSAVPGAQSYKVWRENAGGAVALVANVTGVEWIDASASSGATHYYWLSVVGACAETTRFGRDPGFAALMPITPGGLTATNNSCREVRLTWNDVPQPRTFHVLRSRTNDLATAVEIQMTSSRSFQDESAEPGVQFFYWITSENNCGLSQPSSAVVGMRSLGAPASPADLRATNGEYCDRVELSWSAVPSAGMPLPIRYTVWRSAIDEPGTAESIGSTWNVDFSDDEGDAGTVYYYWVTAQTQSCGETVFAASDTGYQNGRLAGPQNVRATDGTRCDEIRVQWDEVAGADGYTVLRGTTNNSSTASVIEPDISVTEFIDDTAALNTTYYYWVRALAPQGSPGNPSPCVGPGDLSAPDTGLRRDRMPAPLNLIASDGEFCGRVELNWDAVESTSEYNVRRNTTASINSAQTIASRITATQFTDTNVSRGVTYYYWVTTQATNGCASSELLPPESGSAALQLDAPASVSASDGTVCDRVRISWDAVADATRYRIWRGTADNSAAAVSLATRTTTTYDDTTAAVGTTYYYWVTTDATGDCNASLFGDSDSGFRAATLSPPTGLSASDHQFCDAVNVQWNPVVSAAEYRVFRNTVNNASTAVQIATVLAAPHLDTTTAPGTTYFYWVRAANGCNTTAFSTADAGVAGCPNVPGDLNCDGQVTVGDISGFVLALTDPAAYGVQYPNCDIALADINGDDSVTVGDLGPFVNLLLGGG